MFGGKAEGGGGVFAEIDISECVAFFLKKKQVDLLHGLDSFCLFYDTQTPLGTNNSFKVGAFALFFGRF